MIDSYWISDKVWGGCLERVRAFTARVEIRGNISNIPERMGALREVMDFTLWNNVEPEADGYRVIVQFYGDSLSNCIVELHHMDGSNVELMARGAARARWDIPNKRVAALDAALTNARIHTSLTIRGSGREAVQEAVLCALADWMLDRGKNPFQTRVFYTGHYA